MTTGGVRCWGYNGYGQLGDGTTTDRSSPPTADVLSDVQAIAVGEGSDHTCALMKTGGVRCWGHNAHGQLGDDTTTNRSSPPASDVLSNVSAISTGGLHTCALMKTGGVRCWGHNHDGELGDGTWMDRPSPPTTDVLSGVQAIAAGGADFTCALMKTGGVRCWGSNAVGQQGNGSGASPWIPPTTDVLSDVQALSVGYQHTCALMMTGGVRCWGANVDSLSPPFTRSPPTTDMFSGAQAIAPGHTYTCAVMTTGGVLCWGANSYGQLGDGTSGDSRLPTRVKPTVPSGLCR